MEESLWTNPSRVFWDFIFKFLGHFFNTEWRNFKGNAEDPIVQSLVWAEFKSIVSGSSNLQ